MDVTLSTALTPARRALFVQLLRFGTVGGAGFVVQTLGVYAAKPVLGLYGSWLVAYMLAVTTTWALNRLWTFKGFGVGSRRRQWALFVVSQLGGAALNYATYVLLVTFVPFCAAYPIVAIGAGAVAGLFANFNLSRRVFGAHGRRAHH